ncbi:MAG: hypothetical protein FWH04_09900 [Oscillospiraceae bacterium]|nr:hypothetical protein [Oscillospiraceae bacterium]
MGFRKSFNPARMLLLVFFAAIILCALNYVTADIAIRQHGSSFFIFSSPDTYYRLNTFTKIRTFFIPSKYAERDDLLYLNKDIQEFAHSLYDGEGLDYQRAKVLQTYKHDNIIYFELGGIEGPGIPNYHGVYKYDIATKNIVRLENSGIRNFLRTSHEITRPEFFTEIAIDIYPLLYENLVMFLESFEVEYVYGPSIDAFFIEKERTLFILFDYLGQKNILYEYFHQTDKIHKICTLPMSVNDLRILR